MSARKFLRVELALTDLSHLVCIACGKFRVDFAIIVGGPALDDEIESHAGIHKKCINLVKIKRGVK